VTQALIIDCDVDPIVPNGWRILEEDQLIDRVRGQLLWDQAMVRLQFSTNQEDGSVLDGIKFRDELELENDPVLSANVLDFLLENPHLIPSEWKKDANKKTLYIFFWGTLYRSSNDGLYVRCLFFGGGKWRSNYYLVDSDSFDNGPAAVYAR